MSRVATSILFSSRISTAEPDEMRRCVPGYYADTAVDSLTFSHLGTSGPSFNAKFKKKSSIDLNRMVSEDVQEENTPNLHGHGDENVNVSKHRGHSNRKITGELEGREFHISQYKASATTGGWPSSEIGGLKRPPLNAHNAESSHRRNKKTPNHTHGDSPNQKPVLKFTHIVSVKGPGLGEPHVSSNKHHGITISSSGKRAKEDDEVKKMEKTKKAKSISQDGAEVIPLVQSQSMTSPPRNNKEEANGRRTPEDLLLLSPSRHMSLRSGGKLFTTPQSTRSQTDQVGPLHQVDFLPIADKEKVWNQTEETGGEVLWDPVQANKAREARFDFESIEAYLFDPEHSLPVKTLMMEALHKAKYDPTKVMGEFVQLVKDERSRGVNHDTHMSDEEQEQLEALLQQTSKCFKEMSRVTGHSMDAIQVWYYGWKGGKNWTP